MTAIWIAAAAAMGFIVTSAPAASAPVLSAATMSCISDNAAKVEEAIPSLNDATEYLVSSVCALQVAEDAAASTRQSMQKLAGRTQEACEKAKRSAANKSAAAGADQEDVDPCAMADAYSDPDIFASWSLMGSLQRNPAAISYAAKLMIDLRLARLHARH